MRNPVITMGALVCFLILSPVASAMVRDSVVMDPPVNDRQTLTVTMSNDATGPSVVVFATYRLVSSDSPPPPGEQCAETIADNHDTRLIDGVHGGPQPYSVTRSVDLPLGIFAVCLYRASGSEDPAAAPLTFVDVAGAYRPGGSGGGRARTPTSIGLFVVRHGSRARFSGRVRNASTGRVAIQRRVARRFRTVARARVRRGHYAVTIRVRRGQVYRAVLRGTKTTRPSRTRAIRLR